MDTPPNKTNTPPPPPPPSSSQTGSKPQNLRRGSSTDQSQGSNSSGNNRRRTNTSGSSGSGRKYEFGDLSRKARVGLFYHMISEISYKVKEGVTNYTNKQDYTFGDISKTIGKTVFEHLSSGDLIESGDQYEQLQSSHNTNIPQPERIGTDTRLLLASLEKEAVEDEAEQTLLDVLERRTQVTFANQDLVAPPTVSGRHRRVRSRVISEIPNISMNLDEKSTIMQQQSQPPTSRPTLSHNRVISYGSRRNLLKGSPPSLRKSSRAVTTDWTGSAEEEEQDNGILNKASRDSEGENRPRVSSLPTNSYSTRSNRHHRGNSAYTFSRGISESSQTSSLVSSGLTTPGERARHVALTMKNLAASNNVDDSNPSIGECNLPDLLEVIEQQRENDELSTGSQQRSIRSGGKSKGSRVSFDKSHGGSASNFSGSGRAQKPFGGITLSSTPFSNNGFMSNVDHLFEVAERVHELAQIEEEEQEEDVEDFANSATLAKENANFLSQVAASHPEVSTFPDDMNQSTEEDAVDEETPMLEKRGRRFTAIPSRRKTTIFTSITKQLNPSSRFYKLQLWWSTFRSNIKMIVVAFDPKFVKDRLWDFFQNEVTMFIVPALAVSAFFFYNMNNPILFKTNASVSWWILFGLRHYITLQLAYAMQYLLVDVLALRSLVSIQLFGPLATLYTINAKGWPFILTSWGILNFLLIQENNDTNKFFSHWLHFTGWDMFSSQNASGSIVSSATYREVLVSMIIAGVATSIKRTVLAMYLGKRVYSHYKPKMEVVMESMILLTEVAEMANAIGDFEFETVDNTKGTTPGKASNTPAMLQDKIRESTMLDVAKKKDTSTANIDFDDDEDIAEEPSIDNIDDTASTWNKRFADKNNSFEENVDDEPMDKVPSQGSLDKVLPPPRSHDRVSTEQYINTEEMEMPVEGPPVSSIQEPVRGLLHDVSTTTRIRNLLDEWEEPVNKADRVADPTIHEILQFRKALGFLDDTHPFGSSYGPGNTREENIKSAKNLYRKLLQLEPENPTVHFDVIGVLAYNIDGTFDSAKAKALVKLFRPSRYDTVSLLHFVQSCDAVYKKIRYLRAGVGNATLIDSVLENIFNSVFGFALVLTLMSILKMNPWTLESPSLCCFVLVSMSTVLVSFAFALGPSAAKLIEGMIMIAFRRPFDLGDRISIVDCIGAPDNSDDPGYHDTWIVEDCNLFTTTIRLSRTNEVSTVNNGNIANTRIVNHGRSMRALVNIHLDMKLNVTHEQVQIVKSTIQQYIRDSPRVWVSLINFRISNVDVANDRIVYSVRIQHVKSWQDLLPILQAKGELEKFATEILMRLGIHFEHFYDTSHVYVKELPEQAELLPPGVLPNNEEGEKAP